MNVQMQRTVYASTLCRCNHKCVTCFPFLAHATVSSSSAPQFSSAVFPRGELDAGPSPPHHVHPPTTTQAQDH